MPMRQRTVGSISEHSQAQAIAFCQPPTVKPSTSLSMLSSAIDLPCLLAARVEFDIRDSFQHYNAALSRSIDSPGSDRFTHSHPVAARVSQKTPAIPRLPDPASPTTETTSAPPATPAIDRTTCSDGRLLIGDLTAMDERWEAGVEQAFNKATKWQDDAKLSSLQSVASCSNLVFDGKPRFIRQALRPSSNPTLDVSRLLKTIRRQYLRTTTTDLSFDLLRQALNAEGYDDSTGQSFDRGRIATKYCVVSLQAA